MTAITERETLDDIEAKIRDREEQAHPVDLHALTAVLNARRDSGMGIHLENSCPYIRSRSENPLCEKSDILSCVGKDNYRKCPMYATTITLDAEMLKPLAPFL